MRTDDRSPAVPIIDQIHTANSNFRNHINAAMDLDGISPVNRAYDLVPDSLIRDGYRYGSGIDLFLERKLDMICIACDHVPCSRARTSLTPLGYREVSRWDSDGLLRTMNGKIIVPKYQDLRENRCTELLASLVQMLYHLSTMSGPLSL